MRANKNKQGASWLQTGARNRRRARGKGGGWAAESQLIRAGTWADTPSALDSGSQWCVGSAFLSPRTQTRVCVLSLIHCPFRPSLFCVFNFLYFFFLLFFFVLSAPSKHFPDRPPSPCPEKCYVRRSVKKARRKNKSAPRDQP